MARRKRRSKRVPIRTSRLVGKSLIVAATITRSWISRVLDILWGAVRPDGLQHLTRSLRNSLTQTFVGLYNDHLQAAGDSFLAGWIVGTDQIGQFLPRKLLNIPPKVPGGPMEILEGTTIDIGTPQRLAPLTRYPAIEKAAQRVQQKNLALPDDFQSIYSQGTQQVLPFVQDIIDSAARDTGDLIDKAVRYGYGFDTFKKQFTEKIGISTSHKLEGLYRDTVNEAISKGKEDTLQDPLVGEAFPYVWTSPIRDGRLTDLCEIVSSSGINGTQVFRRDDPVWGILKPPRHYNCRCSWFPATPKFIARNFNVPEAKKWALSGNPPANPSYVKFPKLPKEAQDLLDAWLAK